METQPNAVLEAGRPAKRAKTEEEPGALSSLPELEGIRQSETQLAYLQAQLAATEALYSAYEEELHGLANQLKGVKQAHLKAGKPLWKEGEEPQARPPSSAQGTGAGAAAADPATFSDLEEEVLLQTEEAEEAEAAAAAAAAAAPGATAAAATGAGSRALPLVPLPERLAALEASCSAISQEDMEAQGAVGCLAGRSGRYYLRSTAVTLGRATDTKGDVDVDLAPEEAAAAAATAGRAGGAGTGGAAAAAAVAGVGQAGAPGAGGQGGGQPSAAGAGASAGHSVSRRQALLRLGPDGQFRLTNMGRQAVVVNDVPLPQGQTVCLPHLSLIEIGGDGSSSSSSSVKSSGGVRLLFLANLAAVGRVVRRSSALVL